MKHMVGLVSKTQRSIEFRARLIQAMDVMRMSRSELARLTGVDRSTISQLLNDEGARLPNAHVVGQCASALAVTSDWLLGLSDRPERAQDLIANALQITQAPRALVDEQIFEWHKQAAGYKIRHVPAGLPDMFKTHAMLSWEYTPHLGRSTQQAIGASEDRLAWMRQAQSEYEIAFARHEIESFANAEGYYRGIPLDVRRSQLERFAQLHEDLYPRARIYMYDPRALYSAPITVFGSQLAVLYLGRNYIAFRDRERIDGFTTHFDNLVRKSLISARDWGSYLSDLLSNLVD